MVQVESVFQFSLPITTRIPLFGFVSVTENYASMTFCFRLFFLTRPFLKRLLGTEETSSKLDFHVSIAWMFCDFGFGMVNKLDGQHLSHCVFVLFKV